MELDRGTIPAREKNAQARLLKQKNKAAELALEAERLALERARVMATPQTMPASGDCSVMSPEKVMAKLSAVADLDDPKLALPALIELSRVYSLAKRDHGADSRVDKFNNLSGASDDELDSALNRGIVGQ